MKLVVEVALSSTKKGRLVKAPLYARSGFDEYWLVDVAAGCVEVYRGPSGDGYREVRVHASGATLSIEAFPGVSVRVDDIFA